MCHLLCSLALLRLGFFVLLNHLPFQMSLHLYIQGVTAAWQVQRLLSSSHTLEGQTVEEGVTAATGWMGILMPWQGDSQEFSQ